MSIPVFRAAFACALLAGAATPAPAQALTSAAQVSILDALMRYRMEWLGDSTRFDACSASAAIRPARLPPDTGVAALPLLDRPGAPCARRPSGAPVSGSVRVEEITVADTTAEATATVRFGRRFHRERYAFARRGAGWEVRRVELSEMRMGVILTAGPERPLPPELRPLVVLDGIVQAPGTGFAAGTLLTPAGDTVDPADIDSVQILRASEATARYGPAGRNGAILIQLRRPPTRPPLLQVPLPRDR